MPALAGEGLTAERLGLLARRVNRVEAALFYLVGEAQRQVQRGPWPDDGPVTMDSGVFFRLPEEIALRILGRAIAWTGHEGPVELGKLEALSAALVEGHHLVLRGRLARFRRTLAGALITLDDEELRIERAPPRRSASKRP
jgi:tRNA(Ile)-lysidine synthase